VDLHHVSRGVDLTDLPRAAEIAAALRRYRIKVLTPAG
jgi:hypothetical protein